MAVIHFQSYREENDMRKPVVSGMFYKSGDDELKKEVDSAFEAAKEKSEYSGKTIGVVSPHAGYIYSGKTAAAAIASV